MKLYQVDLRINFGKSPVNGFDESFNIVAECATDAIDGAHAEAEKRFGKPKKSVQTKLLAVGPLSSIDRIY